MKRPKTHPIILVSLLLSPESKAQLKAICHQRGMTIKTLLGRLIGWVFELDRTEQSSVLGQVEESDKRKFGEMITRRE